MKRNKTECYCERGVNGIAPPDDTGSVTCLIPPKGQHQQRFFRWPKGTTLLSDCRLLQKTRYDILDDGLIIATYIDEIPSNSNNPTYNSNKPTFNCANYCGIIDLSYHHNSLQTEIKLNFGNRSDLQKKLFVSQSTFLRVEMCHQNSLIRDINLTKKQCDSRHNLVPKHKNHAQKSNLVH